MAQKWQDQAIMTVLRKKSHGTVAIFDKGDHYKCYREDAILVANDIFHSEVGLRKAIMSNDEVVYLNLNNAQYTKVVKDLLLLLRYRVEVYEESNAKLSIRAKGVLGNLVDFEDIVSNCVELTELSTLMCARLLGNDFNKENHVSLCFCNAQEMRIVVSEYNDSSLFPLVEQSIVSLNPRECVLFEYDSNCAPIRFKHLEKAIERSNLQKTVLTTQFGDLVECRNDIRKILKLKHKDFQLGDGFVQGLHSLLTHMQLLGDDRYLDTFTLVKYGSAGFMYLSNAAVQALEIFSPSDEQYGANSLISGSGGGAATTLYDLLNRCRSQCGRKLLREWMRRPLFDLRRIQERLDVVEALCASHETRFALYDDLLRRVPDISLLARRLSQKKASLQDCYRLYQLVRLLQRFVSTLEQMTENIESNLHSAIRELLMEPIRHSCAEFERFTALVESTFDVKHCEQTGQYRIKPDIDENLAEMAAQISEIDKRAQRVFDKLSSKLNTDSVKMESNAESGYYFRLTLKSEKVIRNAPSSLGINVFETTKGGGVRFTVSAIEEINREFCEIQSAYEAGQVELTKAVITTCAGYIPALQILSERLGVLDVLTAFAVVAASSSTPYVRPELLEKGTNVFELIECRHPVVEQLPSVQFIPNDTRLGGKHGRFVVLTGANMGGKSTYLRANALAVFMAQMGCFVACTSARFSLVDGIFTRVGAADYQSKGVSTFMAEMMDCATIFETATQHSLIIVDELGRGTSTYDGFGLAWAIAEEIITRVQCFCFFASHFHELSKLKQQYPESVENFKVETIIDENGKLTILYQVVPGVADRSFGLNVAKLVGFPDSVINEASKVLDQLENTTSEN